MLQWLEFGDMKHGILQFIFFLFFRIFLTTLSTLCPFSLYHKNGSGVSRGVAMPQNPRRKPLISVTTPWQKSRSFRSDCRFFNPLCIFRNRITPYLFPYAFSSFIEISCNNHQGARRIVPEWPDLDLEARTFTAKILGDVNPQTPNLPTDQADNSASKKSIDEDVEAKAEL